jgi:hypothetical protein
MTLEDMILDPDAGWRWLVKSLRVLDREAVTQPFRQPYRRITSGACGTPDAAIDTQWQLGFTRLQQLRIEIQADNAEDEDDTDGMRGLCCALGPERLSTLVRLLKETEILLRAKRVELLCKPWSWTRTISAKNTGIC